ncbi:MAG: hypothetical protein M3Q14_01850 [bacterium]|nr:hypothetical protein [bacterium]
MSSSDTSTGVLGATTGAAGVASLPFTAGGSNISIVSLVAIAIGTTVVVFHLATRVATYVANR